MEALSCLCSWLSVGADSVLCPLREPRPGTGLWLPMYSPSTPAPCQAFVEDSLFWISPQMEDGHTLFDYDVRLNDTIQLLVRQSLALPPSTKERDSELSDSDSGYGVGQSESDKSSTHGEGAVEGDDKTVWEDTELGLYKVRLPAGVWRRDSGFLDLPQPRSVHCQP